jgi:hypothetical protein
MKKPIPVKIGSPGTFRTGRYLLAGRKQGKKCTEEKKGFSFHELKILPAKGTICYEKTENLFENAS